MIRETVKAYSNTNVKPDPVNLGKRAPCEDEQTTGRKQRRSEATGVKPGFWATLGKSFPGMNELKSERRRDYTTHRYKAFCP